MKTIEIATNLHSLMIIFTIGIILFIITIGKQTDRYGYTKQFSRLFGLSLLTLWIVYNIYYFLPANFKIDVSLPLHVCDILAIIASLSMFGPNRKKSALLYFCALPLAGQAILTPIGDQDPNSFRFWMFWLLHAGIISASIYDLVVRKYRPILKDYWFVAISLLVYGAVILPINILFGWNYGYIGNQTPDSPTLIDQLGVWPERLIWMVMIILLVQFMMYLPWKLLKGGKSDGKR